MTRPISRPVRFGAGLFLTMALAGLATVSARGAGQGTIPWRDDLHRALQEARERNLLVWVQFTGPWCPSCHPDGAGVVDGSPGRRLVPRAIRPGQAAYRRPRGPRGPLRPGGDPRDDHPQAVGRGRLQERGVRRVRSPSWPSWETPWPGPCPCARSPRPRGGHGGSLAATGEAEAEAEAEVSLAGYCPVSLVRDHRLVPGQPDHRLEHDGHEYRFADSGMRSMFRSQPERFIPVNAGRCPVDQVDRGESVAGDPRWGVLYQGHLYLCADRQGRDRFLKNPERYAYVDAADRGYLSPLLEPGRAGGSRAPSLHRPIPPALPAPGPRPPRSLAIVDRSRPPIGPRRRPRFDGSTPGALRRPRCPPTIASTGDRSAHRVCPSSLARRRTFDAGPCRRSVRLCDLKERRPAFSGRPHA